jgi:hypothetical protein
MGFQILQPQSNRMVPMAYVYHQNLPTDLAKGAFSHNLAKKVSHIGIDINPNSDDTDLCA